MTRRRLFRPRLWVPAILAAAVLAGCGLNGPAHKAPLANAAAVVDMGFMSFTPKTITIHKGDTVEWRNTSPIKHTVTDEPSKADRKELAGLPKGAQAFDSEKINAGGIYVHKFTVPGTYKYYCEIHDDHGMAGEVIVTP